MILERCKVCKLYSPWLSSLICSLSVLRTAGTEPKQVKDRDDQIPAIRVQMRATRKSVFCFKVYNRKSRC